MRPALLIAIAVAAGPAAAQERTPPMREALVGLTRVLGESQALRQACESGDDQFWRSKMNRLVETEQADEELESRMKASFNAGLAETRRLYPFCGDSARRAQALSAVRGQELAETLAHARYRTGVQPAPIEGEAPAVEGEPH